MVWSKLKKTLQILSDNNICLRCWTNINWIIVHKRLFANSSWISIKKLKKNYKQIKKKINEYNEKLNKIYNYYQDNKIISAEINYHINVHKFLLDIYDIDANKLNKDFKIKKIPNYDFYSELFYSVRKKDIPDIDYNPEYNTNYIWTQADKKEIIKLLNITKKFFPKLKYYFSDNFWNMAVSWFDLYIPNKDFYNLKEIITLFFHEMSHFIRMNNMYKNTWIKYWFFNNYKIEEGIALYNEYYYWNQIIDYGEYYPWYDKIYNILFNENYTEQEKKDEIYKILYYRWFDKDKTEKYYQRFYRHAPLWWTELFLKESIYSRSLDYVNRLLKEWYSISYLMQTKWDINIIKELGSIYKIKENNIHKKYFNQIRDQIIKLI